MNWTHNTHNKTGESPRHSFTIFTIILSFFLKIKKKFKSSTVPLIFTFITYYFAKKKEKRPEFFLQQTSYIYIFYNFLTLFFFSFFSLTLYFWNSKLYSRFLIYAFWYLLSILYLYFLYNLCDFVFVVVFFSPSYFFFFFF